MAAFTARATSSASVTESRMGTEVVNLHGVRWRKSTYSSGGGNADCVEVATTGDLIAVRDSKYPDAGILTFTTPQWRAFLTGAKAHRFDLD